MVLQKAPNIEGGERICWMCEESVERCCPGVEGGGGRACGVDKFFFPTPLWCWGTLIVFVHLLTLMVSPKWVSWVWAGGRFGRVFDEDPKQWRIYGDLVASTGKWALLFLRDLILPLSFSVLGKAWDCCSIRFRVRDLQYCSLFQGV